MNKKYSRFLIVTFVLASVFGVYSYFYNDLESEAATGDSQSALASSLTTDSITSQASGNKTSDDTAFLMKLASLKKIKIDTSILTSHSFKSLVDNHIKLEKVPYGRVNPFSPTGDYVPSTIKATEFTLKTSIATLIINKSATLNGSLTGETSSNIYFEYGPTEDLGNKTAKVTPATNGDFSAVITALTPKTTYYFRAAANVNGTISYGEIMSFKVN